MAASESITEPKCEETPKETASNDTDKKTERRAVVPLTRVRRRSSYGVQRQQPHRRAKSAQRAMFSP